MSGKNSPTPSGPHDGCGDCNRCPAESRTGIAYYPPLFVRPRSTACNRRTQTEIHAALFAPTRTSLDGMVEYNGEQASGQTRALARHRPSSAPTKVCALPGSASRRSRCSANDLSWRLESTRHTAPVRTGKNTNASLLRSKMTLKLSGMENLRQIEQDVLLCDSSPGMTARDVEADIAREAREAKRKQETERINRTLAEKSRFIVHVPPSSKFSKFKVLGPDLYEKWTPRTVAFLYPEGLSKHPTPEPIVMMAVEVKLTSKDFNNTQTEACFKKALADAARVDLNQVILGKISDGGRVDVMIKAKDGADASKIASLMTIDTMNTKLMANGLPKAAVIEQPLVQYPGFCVFDFLTNTAHLPFDTASSLVTTFVAAGFTTRSKIFAMTDSDLLACGIAQQKLRNQIMTYIEFGDNVSTCQRSLTESKQVRTSEAYVNMKKNIQEIKSRNRVGVADETKKYSRFRCLTAGNAAVDTAWKRLADEATTSLVERVLDAKTHRDNAAMAYDSITDSKIKHMHRKYGEMMEKLKSTPRSMTKHKMKEQAQQMHHDLLKEGVTLDFTKKRIGTLNQAITETEFTIRALKEFDLEDGTAIVDKSRHLEEEISRALEQTTKTALTAALDNIKMLYEIELAASLAAAAAVHLQQKKEKDLKQRLRFFKELLVAGNSSKVVEVVQIPCCKSEQQMSKLLASKTGVYDPLVAVLLHKLDQWKEAMRWNEQELAKVQKWIETNDKPLKAPTKHPEPQRTSGSSKSTREKVQNAVEETPEPAPTLVNWADKNVDMQTKIMILFSGICGSDRALALEKGQDIAAHLKPQGAKEAAIQGVLQNLDERCGAACRDADLASILTDDEEAVENEGGHESTHDDGHGTREPESNKDGTSGRSREAKKIEDVDEKARKRAEAKIAEAKAAEAKRKADLAWNVPIDKLWQIEFRVVDVWRLFSFSEERIASARQNSSVIQLEEQVAAMHEKNATGLEGIVEGCRALYKREKWATIAALEIEEAQRTKTVLLKKQVDDLIDRIQSEPEDETVQKLTTELKQAQQDVKKIDAIFRKVGQCPGPVKAGTESTWCWLHCCGHTTSDKVCRKWIKKGDKFHCCGGEHWVCKTGNSLIKTKG